MPSQFIEYYLGNGKKSEGTFYDYLYNRDTSKEIFTDFLGSGLLKKIQSQIK